MACFLVPLAEALVVTAVKAVALRRSADSVIREEKKAKLNSLREAVGTLQKMLFGGSFLVAIEHIYHGEISFFPPFLTALKTPEDIPIMLHEMATVGVGMAVLTTTAWGVLVGLGALSKRVKRGSGKNQSLNGELSSCASL